MDGWILHDIYMTWLVQRDSDASKCFTETKIITHIFKGSIEMISALVVLLFKFYWWVLYIVAMLISNIYEINSPAMEIVSINWWSELLKWKWRET